MNYKEMAKSIIDQIPDSKMYYIIAYLQGAAVPDEVPNIETIFSIDELENDATLDENEEVVDMCQAIAELREEMKTEGIEQGTEQLGRLIDALIASGRMNEVQKAATDKQTRDILYKEFNIL